jgi:formylglycine-generating enzyme required for sulfatase activity
LVVDLDAVLAAPEESLLFQAPWSDLGGQVTASGQPAPEPAADVVTVIAEQARAQRTAVAAPPRARHQRKSLIPPQFRWPRGLAIAAAGAAAVLLLAVVIYVKTDGGTVKIELSDPTANVEVKVDGKQRAQPKQSGKTESPPPAIAPFDAATAKQRQAAWAKHLGVPVEITNSIGMKLVLIPPGEFLMGSPDSDLEAAAKEKPQHRVQITKPFYLATYEVTQAEYQKVLGINPSTFKDSGEDAPVESVSWDDAQTFCRKLSELSSEQASGRPYRLSTEAEWEYACRAGSTSKYSFGDSEEELGNYAWYDRNAGNKTHPVGEKQANAWGLYDMHGNVKEWCQDWDGPYEAGPASDPLGPGSASRYVFRGGCWYRNGWFCRSADRDWGDPGRRDRDYGIRVVLVQSDPSYGERSSTRSRERRPASEGRPAFQGR